MSIDYDRTASPAIPSSEAMAGGTAAHTLRDFASGGQYEGTASITEFGNEVIALGYSDADPAEVEVYSVHGTYPLPADTPVAALSGAARQAGLLRACVVHLLCQLRDARVEQRRQAATHARVLEEIRRYAIDQHLDDEFCRDGLNAFLRTFGMPQYTPRVRVSYTVTGTYEVDSQDAYSAERDGRGYLKVDLSQVDAVIDDSDSFSVEITDTTTLDT